MATEPQGPGKRDNVAPDDWIGTDPVGVYFLRRLEELDRRLVAEKQQDEAPAVIPKQRFDWTINTGNVLVLITILVASVAAYGGWTQSTAVMQEAIKQNARDIQANTDADRHQASVYAPRLDTMEKLVSSMVGRLDNQGDSLIEMRKGIADLMKVSAEMHENLAIMKMQQDRDREHDQRRSEQQTDTKETARR